MKSKNNKNINNQQDAGENSASFVERKCVGCNKIFDRKKMIRILKNHKNGKLVLNPDNKTFGRSAYICKNEECLQFAIKKKRLQKVFKTHIDEKFFEDLKKNMTGLR